MRDQHDAPPREAVEAVTFLHGRPRIGLPYPGEEADAIARMLALRTLPAAARWRLIAWLARGLESTRGMVDAGMSAYRANGHEPRLAPTLPSIITAALAAAAEAGDGE